LELSFTRFLVHHGVLEINLEVSILAINEETGGVGVRPKGDGLSGLTGGNALAAHFKIKFN